MASPGPSPVRWCTSSAARPPSGIWPTVTATATGADRGGRRRAATLQAPRSQALANSAELGKQSLKLGVPDPRGSKTALRCPVSGRGPWAQRDRKRRTALTPGRDRVPCVLTACSRDVALLHATGRDDRRLGVAHALLSPQRLDRKRTRRNGPQMTHKPAASGHEPRTSTEISGIQPADDGPLVPWTRLAHPPSSAVWCVP